ncbi:MAG: preprotein translocase subunit SecA [Chloroflexi bacterium]|nr:preprotein translocase subunit SecA [Chloroflexota bacterium]
MASVLSRLLSFGDSNEGELKRLRKIVALVNERRDATAALSDDELRGRTAYFRERLANGETLDDILPEVFAAVREAGTRTLKQTHFDVQLLGGIALHKGHIAEMRTGEGKTLVASLALYLNALEGRGAHLVTTNDYLAKTGAGWMGPIYDALGMSVAYVAHEKSAVYDPAITLDELDPRHQHWRTVDRRGAYLADITYGQNSEFGFDYLRDNMVMELAEKVQRELHYAIVDEADSILIDEARTPLIISSAAEDSSELYHTFARVAARLQPDVDYELQEKHHAVSLTEAGVAKAEQLLGRRNLYEGDVTAIHHLDNAVKARALYHKDKEYIVSPAGEVVIIDEFTGRQMPGRRWSDGLHQAVEAKEGVKIQRETRTFATITIQNYFRMYHKLAGMTGTAATEAEELFKVYKLDVTQIPTNKPMIRRDDPDLVYKTEQGKWDAVVREVKERNAKGQPVLIGTTSVEKSQQLSEELKRNCLKHEVLNAKNHDREALVISQAGQKGAITLSTNMAGRGVDILLAPGVPDLGGLHVIGTERHEARRIDNQLRGRAGRQGDPGSTRFYTSLEDDLIRIFASERVAGLMGRLGFDDSAPIESGMVTGAITQAQIKVETRNFDIRKRALEFDDVLNNQRNVIYGQRKTILDKGDVKETILDFLHDEVAVLVDEHASSPDPDDWDKEALLLALRAVLGLGAELTAEALAVDSQAELTEKVETLVDETYEAREAAFGPELMRAVERWVLLRTIDTHWTEHLTAMEELREGIYLRGYGQQDPLVAYKGEAHRFFDEMTARIATGVAQTILRVSVKTAEQAEQDEAQRTAATPVGTTTTTSAATTARSSGSGSRTATAIAPAKIGRNDPCYCGSGKKYKKCHGR